MGILDEVASATGNKNANEELVKRCLQTPALLHTIAEGLRTGAPPARIDCAQIMVDVAKRWPDQLANFSNDFLEASRNEKKKVATLGFTGLAIITPVNPSAVFAERKYLLDVAAQGGALGIAALKVIATLCKHNANYRGKLLSNLLRMVQQVPAKELPKWIAAAGPAVEGSADGVKRLDQSTSEKRKELPDAAQKRIDKVFTKLEKTTVKK
jgi:hypothetical protein